MSPALPHALRSSFFALVLVLAACSRPPPPAAAPVAAPVAAPPSTTPAAAAKAETVCDLITADELETVFSGTSTATPEHHQTFGIKACEWNGDFGRLLVQQWPSKGHTPQDEVRDLVTGFIDASNPGARAGVRLVSPPGLGHYATAVVEPRDLERGVLAAAQQQDQLQEQDEGDQRAQDQSVDLHGAQCIGRGSQALRLGARLQRLGNCQMRRARRRAAGVSATSMRTP